MYAYVLNLDFRSWRRKKLPDCKTFISIYETCILRTKITHNERSGTVGIVPNE